MSYNTKVYHNQGGETVTVASGGSISVASGGSISVASGGNVSMPVTVLTGATTGTIPAYGFTSLVASTTAPDYTLDAPAAGKVVMLRVESNTSSGTCTVTTTAAFDAAGSKNKLLLNAADDAVTLCGVSSTGWAIISNVGSVATTSG